MKTIVYIHNEIFSNTMFMHFYGGEVVVSCSAWNARAEKWKYFNRSYDSAIRIAAKHLNAGHSVEASEPML
jgi:hypothetical protein